MDAMILLLANQKTDRLARRRSYLGLAYGGNVTMTQLRRMAGWKSTLRRRIQNVKPVNLTGDQVD
jgi:hypothetical protein